VQIDLEEVFQHNACTLLLAYTIPHKAMNNTKFMSNGGGVCGAKYAHQIAAFKLILLDFCCAC
jgi:hypothetical protein